MMPDETPDAPPADNPAELAAVRAKLNATEQELNNYKLKLADFDNARKRLLRDAEIERKYAIEPLARDLLAALDNLDRALDAARRAGDTGPLATGVTATAAQILEALKRHGITRIECNPGTVFDTSFHQAVQLQPSTEFAPGEVTQVLQRFTIHDRVFVPGDGGSSPEALRRVLRTWRVENPKPPRITSLMTHSSSLITEKICRRTTTNATPAVTPSTNCNRSRTRR